MMYILALVILILFTIAGFALIFFTTFGTLVILIGDVLFAFLTKFAIIDVKTLVVLLVLYLIGEIFENIFVIAGVKKAGASNLAVAGALFGGIFGALVGTVVFGIGIIPGTFLGIFLGAFLAELIAKRDMLKSLKAGTGGLLGRVGSIATKLIIALVMIGIVLAKII